MIFLLDVDVIQIADATTTATRYFSTEKYGTGSGDTPASTQYVPALRSQGIDSKTLAASSSIEAEGRTSALAAPKDVTVRIYHNVAGKNRVSGIDPETWNLLGQSANLRGVGVGGDGTSYTLSSPFTIANGTVEGHERHGTEYDEITIRPHADAFLTTEPKGRLVGYPNGLRFDGNSAEAEIVGYDSVPSQFTLGAAVLFQRAWDVGASDTQTIAGTRSARLYFTKTTNEYGRQLHFDYEASGATTITIDGPEFDADESVKFITARVDTAHASSTGVEVNFGIDQSFTLAENKSNAFSATAEDWKLGRFRTSTTDSLDTIAGAWFLFSTELADTVLVSYLQSRLTGNESDLVWFFDGTSAGGVLVETASANDSSPLDATITAATAAPLFLGTSSQVGVVMPTILGFQQNAPLTAIDPARKIYRAAYDPVAAISAVVDRQSPYSIEAIYESPLDFADNPPTASGNCTVCPWLGGLVRIHTEVDGVENSADVSGHSIWENSLVLGENLSTAFASRGFNPTGGNDYSFEICFSYDAISGSNGHVIGQTTTGWVEIFASPYANTPDDQFTFRVLTSSGGQVDMTYDLAPRTTHCVRIEAYEDGSDVRTRLLYFGNVVATGEDLSNTLSLGASTTYISNNLDVLSFDLLQVGYMRVWSEVGSSDSDAESKHRQYLYEHPDPSTANLEGLWYRFSTDRTSWIDETSNNYHFTVSSTAVWAPGIASTDRLTASKYLLDKSSTAVTFDSTAYDANFSAIAYFLSGGQTAIPVTAPGGASSQVGLPIAASVPSLLAGGGLYVLLDTDNTATVGLVLDPATATPSATVRVEFVSNHDVRDYRFQPSVIEALYGPNPFVQTSVLSGADADRKAFAERPTRSIEEPVGGNRTLYNDRPAPEGRKWPIDTRFVSIDPAQAEATRIAGHWDSPRPYRTFYIIGRHDSATDQGYTSYSPGTVLKIQNERLNGGEANVLVLDAFKTGTWDRFKAR